MESICYHHEQVFANVFERGESKCCVVLMKYCRKVSIVQQLKTKNVNVIPGQLFRRQCEVKFLLETD